MDVARAVQGSWPEIVKRNLRLRHHAYKIDPKPRVPAMATLQQRCVVVARPRMDVTMPKSTRRPDRREEYVLRRFHRRVFRAHGSPARSDFLSAEKLPLVVGEMLAGRRRLKELGKRYDAAMEVVSARWLVGFLRRRYIARNLAR